MTAPDPLKRCSACRQYLPLACFNLRADRPSRVSQCRACHIETARRARVGATLPPEENRTGKTHVEVAAALGLSRSRVQQIEKMALAKLRRALGVGQ